MMISLTKFVHEIGAGVRPTGEFLLPLAYGRRSGHTSEGFRLGSDDVVDQGGDAVGAGHGGPVEAGVIETGELMSDVTVKVLEESEHHGGSREGPDRFSGVCHDTLCPRADILMAT